MALVAWLDNVKSASPDWETIGKVLVMGSDFYEPDVLRILRATSDTIIFDFLIDGKFIYLYFL